MSQIYQWLIIIIYQAYSMDPNWNMLSHKYVYEDMNIPRTLTILNQINFVKEKKDFMEDKDDDYQAQIKESKDDKINYQEWKQYFSLDTQVTIETQGTKNHPNSIKQPKPGEHAQSQTNDDSTLILPEENEEVRNFDQPFSELSFERKMISKNIEKNIPTYIRQMIVNTLFKEGPCRQKVIKLCQKHNIKFSKFESYCDISKFKGNKKFFKLLKSKQGETQRKMNKILKTLLQTMFRKAYLTTMLTEGNMKKQNRQSYIFNKNKMLYISQLYE